MTQNYPGENKVKHSQSTQIYVGLTSLKAKMKFKILRKNNKLKIVKKNVSGIWQYGWISETCNVAHQTPCLWNFSGKITVLGFHFLLQGIFLTQGSNLHVLRLCISKQNLYHYPCIKFLTVSIVDLGLTTSVAASSLLSICADLIPLLVPAKAQLD